MIVPFTIEKLLGWTAIGILCTWGAIFGMLYLRGRTFLVRKRTKAFILLIFWCLLIGMAVVAFQLENFEYWMFLFTLTFCAIMTMYQMRSQVADIGIYDINPVRALEGLRASLRENNYPFEEDGTGTFVLTELRSKIMLKSFAWSSSTDVNFLFPRHRTDRDVIINHFIRINSGQPYGKFPWLGLVLLVVGALGITFLIVV